MVTTPTNAVEKPATGCGCEFVNTDAPALCPEGKRLHAAVRDAERCMNAAEKKWHEAGKRWTDSVKSVVAAQKAYRAHVEGVE